MRPDIEKRLKSIETNRPEPGVLQRSDLKAWIERCAFDMRNFHNIRIQDPQYYPDGGEERTFEDLLRWLVPRHKSPEIRAQSRVEQGYGLGEELRRSPFDNWYEYYLDIERREQPSHDEHLNEVRLSGSPLAKRILAELDAADTHVT